MITDPSIREQGYIYFLSEAPELLQTIEQELFNLSAERSTATVHNLMRATHTLKGGAANVGLEVINEIAHSLEDIFKALYNPDVAIDAELQTLLFQAYECLQLPVSAEINGSSFNSEDILQRTASIFGQLQEKLGDAFGADGYIPTSEELGFDIVESIFETGVTQSIESIAETIQNPPPSDELGDFLYSQAEIFIGLAESLNLPGFGEIGKTIIAALEVNPTHTLKIAEIALADLQQAREVVLAGDRTRGGEPSPALRELSSVADTDDLQLTEEPDTLFGDTTVISPTTDELQLTEEPSVTSDITSPTTSATFNSLRREAEQLYKFFTQDYKVKNEPLKPAVAKFYLKVIRYILGWFHHVLEIAKQELSIDLLIPKLAAENSLNYIDNWLNDFLTFVEDEEDKRSLCIYRQGLILAILLAVAEFQYSNEEEILVIQKLQYKVAAIAKEYKNHPPVTQEEKQWIDQPKLQKLLDFKEISNPEANPESNQESTNLLETIWGEEIAPSPDEQFVNRQTEENNNDDLEITEEFFNDKLVENTEELVVDTVESIAEVVQDSQTTTNQRIEDKFQTKHKNVRPISFVRVNVEGLQNLNYLAGELLINHKRRTLQDEQLQAVLEQLFQQLSRHQTTINKLRDLPLQIQNCASQNMQNLASVNFDSLEMDEYTEFHLAVHEATEETLQIQETTESLELLLKQSNQIQDKTQRLVLGIIENVDEARMMPLGNILNRFSQMLQNLGNVYGKYVELKLSGTQVLVDKAIAEKLYDPLVHLVRNAFDHGIEAAEIRRQFGKPEQGVIEINAYHQGSQTIIEVDDDGRGLNLEKIHNKAIELNLISSNDAPTQEELLDLLFAPGFSTAGKVTDISGRGMGLDIVRAHLQGLDGSIAVHSLPNQGTTFVLKIPFSMTTDKLMIVQAGGAVYAFLLNSIEKIVLPSAEQIKEFEGKKVLHWNTGKDECMLGIRQLSELISYGGSLASGGNIHNTPIGNNPGEMKHPVLVIGGNQEELLALEVDQIIGEQELVIRPLGNAITPPKYIYGCSSLANGNLILVIDAPLLLESREMQTAAIDTMALPAGVSSKNKALPASSTKVQSTPLLGGSATTNSATIEQPPQLKKNGSKVILVVDDAISLRQTLSLTLQKYGYQVLQAENGVDALEKLQGNSEVQVIISDLEMPRMNGFELLSNLRKNSIFSNIPVAVLTSRSAEKHRQLAQSLGATAYLTKPYLEHEFISTVQRLLNQN
ncbi:MAG: response regulator [Nostocaceae cyanobacterium]|nr:response regulator [Nostocaceae cyanobacterium]